MLPPPNEDTRVAELTRRVENLESALRAAFTTVSGGQGLTIGGGGNLTVDGGRFRVKYPVDLGGGASVYAGDLYSGDTYIGTGFLVQTPSGVDMLMARQDELFGGPRVELYDGGNRIIVSNDAASGQGLARPYVGGAFYRARYADWLSTTSATFETVWRGEIVKQHPKLSVATLSSMDTAGTTGEIKVMVDGVQLGVTKAATFLQATTLFGPEAVAGAHMKVLTVEIQARVTSGTGALKIEPLHLLGRQS